MSNCSQQIEQLEAEIKKLESNLNGQEQQKPKRKRSLKQEEKEKAKTETDHVSEMAAQLLEQRRATRRRKTMTDEQIEELSSSLAKKMQDAVVTDNESNRKK